MISLKERCIQTIYQNQELMKRLGTLPAELQDLIFLTLSLMSSLSDSHLSFWSHSQLSLFDFSLCKNISDAGIKLLVQRFAHKIEGIKLGDSGVTSLSLSIISQNCLQLKSLDLTDMQVKESDFASLKKLSLRTLIMKKVTGLKSRVFSKMLGYWPNLTTLDISGMEYIEGVLGAVSGLKHLSHLVCASYSRRIDSSFPHKNNKLDSPFQNILSCCSSLVSLDISGQEVDINMLKSSNLRRLDISRTCIYPSSDLFFSSLQSNFPRLESLLMVELVAMRGQHLPSLATHTALRELDLSKCISIHSNNVILWGNSSLSPFVYSRLSLSGCKDITDVAFGELAGKLGEQLTELNLSGVWKLNDSLSIVASRCPNLTSLDLSLCKIMSNQSIIDIAKNCPMLRSLELYSCKNVTDEAIIELVENCPDLTLLNLYLLPLTDKSVALFGQKLKNLTSLDCSCTNITDWSLRSIATGCPLTYFASIGCNKVTDEGVTQLVRGCLSLQRLILNECKMLTNVSLYAMAQQLRFLRELSMLGCVQISGEGILNLGQSCPALRTIRLSSGTPITTAQIMSLFNVAPHISLKL